MEPYQQGIQFRPGAFGDYLYGAAVSPIVRVPGESSFQGLVPHKLPEVHSLHATMYQGGKSKEIAHTTSVSGPERHARIELGIPVSEIPFRIA